LICLPTYQISDGDPTIFYATVAGILSGAVAGDHMSPISDTTVLAALASDCKLLAHVVTQAPYATIVIIVSILFGTLPIGRAAWPNIVGILLGFVALCMFVWGICVPIVSPTGRFDIFTLLYMKVKGGSCELLELQTDCIAAYKEANGEGATERPDTSGGLNEAVPDKLDVVDVEVDVDATMKETDEAEPMFSNDITA
jgi:Na+/H+ antiporter family